MSADVLAGGFTDAPIQSAHAFRQVLEAMARPGEIRRVAAAAPPAPLSPAACAVLLTLVDTTTPLHLAGAFDCQAVRDWVGFHLGAPLTRAEEADFAVGTWADLAPASRFRIGLPDYPDRSATLIVEMPDLRSTGAVLTGPGIQATARLSLPEVAAFQANRALFPMGFDTILTFGAQIAALPRSTHVEAG